MEEDDDRGEWLAAAAVNVAVVAHEIICLSKPWKRVSWRKLVRPPLSETGDFTSDLDILEEELGVLERELTLPPSGWGARRRRTRVPGELPTICEEDAAAKEHARASPATPLDFSAASGASVSGGEEGSSGAVFSAAAAAAMREATAKVGPREGAPAVFRIPAAKPVRRPGKKRTMAELQVMEKSYLEERRLLRKELEARRSALEMLAEANSKLKKLKLLLSSKSASPAVGAVQGKQSMEDQESQDRDVFVPLPDLNEPWPEDIN